MHWYCHVNGQQYGPVDLEALREWIVQGRIGPADNVWREGMAAWTPAAAAFPDMFVGAGQAGPVGPAAAPQPIMSMVPAAPAGGTAGRTPNDRITAAARHRLRRHWGLPIGFCVLFGLLSAAPGILPFIGPIAGLIITGPLTLGLTIFFLTFARGGKADIGMLFRGFNRFGTAMAAYLLMALFIALWFLLLGLPGLIIIVRALPNVDRSPSVGLLAFLAMIPPMIGVVVASLAYSQTFYILANDVNIGPYQAIRQSIKIMRGRKGKLFCLHLRFAAWGLLICLPFILVMLLVVAPLAGSTGGQGPRSDTSVMALLIPLIWIGMIVPMLWLVPYMHTSVALFYEDIQPPAQAVPVDQTPSPPGTGPPGPSDRVGPTPLTLE